MLLGYIHGVAVVLIVGQLGKLLGLSIEAREPLAQLSEIVRELGDVSGLTVVVSAVALGDYSRSAGSCRVSQPRSWLS